MTGFHAPGRIGSGSNEATLRRVRTEGGILSDPRRFGRGGGTAIL